jgi:phage baseplate assembly protein gpV
MDQFINAVKQHSAAMDAGMGRARVGTVQSVHVSQTQYTVRVMLQPEGTMSGWLPVLAWQRGVASPPVIGDQVMVEAQEGDAEHGIVVGIIYSDASPAPQFAGASAQSGEFLYVNPKTGSAVYLSNDGKITMKDAAGASMVLQNDGTALIQDKHGSTITLTNDGNITVLGNLLITGILRVNNVTVAVP